MKCKTILFFLSFFLFFFCSPKTKKKSSFSSATSLVDENVDFLPPASDVEYIGGGVSVTTVIPGEASHVEVEFNGVLIKSCSSETLIPEEVATCPIGEENCAIKVRACDDLSGECSDSSSVTVFLDTESASPSDSNAIMQAYEAEQESLALARELKLEACVTAKELEKYPEEEISEEVLGLKDGVKAICETSDCDIMLSFSQFQSDLDNLISQVAVLEDLGDDLDEDQDEEEDSNDVIVIDVDPEDGLSDTEIALTAVSATLGVALLAGGGVGIYLWRKHVRLREEARLKDVAINGLNTKLARLKRQNEDLEAKVAAGGDKAEMSRLQTILKDQKAEVLKLKKQRTYLVSERNFLRSDLEGYKAKGLEAQLEKQREALAAMEKALKESDGEKARALKELEAKVKELETLTARSLSLEEAVNKANLQKTETDGLIASLKAEKERLKIAQRDLVNGGKDSREEIERLKGLLKDQEEKIKDLEELSSTKETELEKANLLSLEFKEKLAAKSSELTALQEKMAKQNLDVKALIPELASLGEEKERLETELKETSDELLEELRSEREENEAKKKRIEELEKDLEARQKASEFDKKSALDKAKELANLKGEVEAKETEIKKLAGVIAEGEAKGKVSRFYLMLQRRIHQSQVDFLYEQWAKQVEALTDQLDTAVQGYMNDKSKSEEVLKKLREDLESTQEKLKNIEVEVLAKDQKLKAASELTEQLEADIDRISKSGGEGAEAKVKVLRARVKKLEAREYYRENIELRNKLKVYATKAQEALFRVLTTKEFKGKTELKKSLGITLLYAQDKGLVDKFHPYVKNFLDSGRQSGFFAETKTKLKKIGLVSSSKTEAFVDTVSDFFSVLTEKHARAYKKSQELGELRLENF